MKKTIYTAALFLTIGIAATSCKKESTPTPTVVGYWVGKYGNGAAAATLDYAFLFKADGTVKVYANNADTSLASKAEGTYSVSGTKINTTYTYPGNIKYSSVSNADAEFTTMSGTWGSGTSTTGNTFYLNKK